MEIPTRFARRGYNASGAHPTLPGAPISLRAASAATPRQLLLQNLATVRPLLQNPIDDGVVDESNVFGDAGDDNDDLL
jgi:hypothetical protein